MKETPIPVDEFNANLRVIGRSLDDASVGPHEWRNGEYVINFTWSDGFKAWIGLGEVGTVAIESYFCEAKH